jgi:glycine/betaine/sarcosine/D-proline reductase family selenoprotein B
MVASIERSGLPVVHITAVPTVSLMIGVSRILQGQSIVNLLGNVKLNGNEEKELRRKYVLRALEILQLDVKEKQVFTLK